MESPECYDCRKDWVDLVPVKSNLGTDIYLCIKCLIRRGL